MLCLVYGNGEMKSRPLAHFAFDPDVAAVRFDKMFGDGKAKPGTADFPGACDIHSVEAFKDPRLVHFWNADARIGDGKRDFVTVR